MTEKPILVSTNIIVDDVWLADGTHKGFILGGAAVWAAVGARAWWPEVGIIAGVGDDLEAVSGGQLRAFGLRPDGELSRDPHTIRSKLVYLPDGERTETPAFGPEHFARLQATPADFPATLLPAAGTYIFRDLWPEFWRTYRHRRTQLGVTLWELQADVAEARHWPDVRALLPELDIVSLNRSEAKGLLGIDDAEDAAKALLDAGARAVVLRMGAEGALIAMQSERVTLTPPASNVIDVTGGGNSFCGGFLAGWCQKPGDLEHAARCGAAAAAICIAQYGLPKPSHLADAPALAARAKTTRWKLYDGAALA